MAAMTGRAEAWKKEGEDLVELTSYPWQTLGESGRWRKDMEDYIGGFLTTNPLTEDTSGIGGGAITPTFAPPGGGMPTGNLIINFIAPDGTYGSQVNFGSWSSLWEKVGQDTVINAGTQNKPVI